MLIGFIIVLYLASIDLFALRYDLVVVVRLQSLDSAGHWIPLAGLVLVIRMVLWHVRVVWMVLGKIVKVKGWVVDVVLLERLRFEVVVEIGVESVVSGHVGVTGHGRPEGTVVVMGVEFVGGGERIHERGWFGR